MAHRALVGILRPRTRRPDCRRSDGAQGGHVCSNPVVGRQRRRCQSSSKVDREGIWTSCVRRSPRWTLQRPLPWQLRLYWQHSCWRQHRPPGHGWNGTTAGDSIGHWTGHCPDGVCADIRAGADAAVIDCPYHCSGGGARSGTAAGTGISHWPAHGAKDSGRLGFSGSSAASRLVSCIARQDYEYPSSCLLIGR